MFTKKSTRLCVIWRNRGGGSVVISRVWTLQIFKIFGKSPKNKSSRKFRRNIIFKGFNESALFRWNQLIFHSSDSFWQKLTLPFEWCLDGKTFNLLYWGLHWSLRCAGRNVTKSSRSGLFSWDKNAAYYMPIYKLAVWFMSHN